MMLQFVQTLISERCIRAFSSESLPRTWSGVETGSRQENASNQESGALFRFNRNEKGSGTQAIEAFAPRKPPVTRLSAANPQSRKQESAWFTNDLLRTNSQGRDSASTAAQGLVPTPIDGSALKTGDRLAPMTKVCSAVMDLRSMARVFRLNPGAIKMPGVWPWARTIFRFTLYDASSRDGRRVSLRRLRPIRRRMRQRKRRHRHQQAAAPRAKDQRKTRLRFDRVWRGSRCRIRELVSSADVTKQFGRRRSHFCSTAKAVWNERLVWGLTIKQRGSIMWDFIIGLIYQQACRNCLAAARKQRQLNQRWA
jgi:hypothetical protein